MLIPFDFLGVTHSQIYQLKPLLLLQYYIASFTWRSMHIKPPLLHPTNAGCGRTGQRLSAA